MSTKFCRIILIVVSWFYQAHLHAQLTQQYITGHVVGEMEKPLPAATVSLFDNKSIEVMKALADSTGHFRLLHSVKGQYTIQITYAGYNLYRSELFELMNKDLGTIRLSIQDSLDEVTVRSTLNTIETDGGNIIFNVAKTINAQGTDALEVLKQAPGVYIDNQQSIYLNGKQGALVLIDGKQTYVSGKELADLLKSMPSSQIKSIEIINDPSSKYDAAGSAGIINIRTSRSTVKGFSGLITTGISYGISVRQNQDISFNYRNNKLNIYGSYNHFIGHYNYDYGGRRTQLGKLYESVTDDIDKRRKMGTRLGVDYNLNKKNTIGVLLTGNFVFGGGRTNTTTGIGTAGSSTFDQTLYAVNDYYFQQTNRYNANINYSYEHKSGATLNVDVDFGSFTKGNGNLQSNIYTDNFSEVLSERYYRSLNNIDIKLGAAKIDYTTPLWKGVLEAGIKYSDVKTSNNARFLHVLQAYDSLDDRRSNNFSFNEHITAGYLNYKKTIGVFNIQAGFRSEHTSSDGTLQFKTGSVDSLQLVKRQYTDLFSSLAVSVKLHELHSASLSYSRRIDRPGYHDLNPFVYLLDELSFWQGNPFLQPQYTSKTSLQYAFKNTSVATLSYSRSSNYSTRITDTMETSKIVMIPRNLGVQQLFSFSLTHNMSLFKWWDLSFTGTLNHIRNKIAFDEYRNLRLQQLGARMSMQQRFRLPFNMIGEISALYSSRRLSGANEIIEPVSQIDLGLQKTVLKTRGTVRLNFSDIYKGSRTNSFQEFDGFALTSYGYYEQRQIRLNFTYKLSDSGIKDPRNRNSALESEQGRIK